jgi:phosphatidylglycerophosphate synthase
MLAGHFGVSYALKAKEQHASLGLLFLAVGFADLLWSLFILLGREQAQLAPTLPSSRLNLSYMPYDHSLVGILFWSIVIYLLFRFLPAKPGARKSSIALVMAVAVFSHFVLDIPVHRADLGLIGNLYKIGLGLYNYPIPAFLLEAACLLGGVFLYLGSTTGSTLLGKYGMIGLSLLLLLINAFSYWGPNPQNIQEVALFLPTVYLVSALLADWVDGKRSPKAARVTEPVQPSLQS